MAPRWPPGPREASRRRCGAACAFRSGVDSPAVSRPAASRFRIADVATADIANPILRERGLKSLLGVPLLVEGTVIGVLHVGTLKPRDFSDDDVQVLQLAGDRAALAIHGRLTERERGLGDALQRASCRLCPMCRGCASPVAISPPRRLTWVVTGMTPFPLPGGQLGLTIGDVVGRGFHAAALMGQLRSGLRAYATQGRSPAEVPVWAERVDPPDRAGAQRDRALHGRRSTARRGDRVRSRPPCPDSGAGQWRCPVPRDPGRRPTWRGQGCPGTRTLRSTSTRAQASSSSRTEWSSAPARRLEVRDAGAPRGGGARRP